MVKNSKLFLVLLFVVILSPSYVLANTLFFEDENSILLSSNLLLESSDKIDISNQEFLNETISYEYGKINPEIREGSILTDYFKKLDLQESYVYILLEFKKNISEKELKELEKDNIKKVGKYGKDIYIYKFPREILETKTYDFINWIDVPKELDKMDNKLKDSLNLNNSLLVKVEFYENYTDEELIKINKYSKFTNIDSWDNKEIYVLVASKINIESINMIEEIASFNFVKSVRLIDIKDKRQINLYINQSDFYKNKSLVNQPHAVCPWQRDQKKSEDLEKRDLPKVISQEKTDNNNLLAQINFDNDLKNTYSHARELGYNNLSFSQVVNYDNGDTALISALNSQNDGLVYLVKYSNKIQEQTFLMKIEKENNSLITFFGIDKVYNQEWGVTLDINNNSVIREWGHHSCSVGTCFSNAIKYFLLEDLIGELCMTLCDPICTEYWEVNPLVCAPCIGCVAGLAGASIYGCSSWPCTFYPCYTDCNDNDGWGNWQTYCSGGDVWRKKYLFDYSCSSDQPQEGSCELEESSSGWGQEEFYQSCSYGCTSGSCNPEIECYSNSDCSADSWTGSAYCSGGDVWQNWRDWSCSNPGTSYSNCVYSDTGQQKRGCSDGCTSGECDESGECSSNQLEEYCSIGSEERVQMYVGASTAYNMGNLDEVYVCGDGYCIPSDWAFGLKFNIDDCDGYLNENLLSSIINVKLNWWNDISEEPDCSYTDLYYYTHDEDRLDNAESNEADLTNIESWDHVQDLTSCGEGYNSLDITNQFKNDLYFDDHNEIAYSWWPENSQDLWGMEDARDGDIDINYCKPCPDEDGDGYSDTYSECGTHNDCNDYNQYINPGSNIYCDCNSGTGGGATQGTYEICDNIDNDCDGSVDEGIAPQGCGLGICSGGTQSCSAGSWGSCSTNYLATVESCNSLDDDCDGSVDEGIASQECGTDTGACVKGTQSCSAGSWGACGGTYISPVNETCNSIDDNCNGIIDESNVCGNYPNTTILSPPNNYVNYNGSVIFNCSSRDNNGLANITLYYNITGNMTANSTKTINGTSNSTNWIINNIPSQTFFVWNCLVYDINSHWSWSVNGPYYVQISSQNYTNLYYKRINITERSGKNLTDYPIQINNFNCNSKCNNTGKDIRITYNNLTQISFGLQKINSSFYNITFRINLLANKFNDSIYIWYGNLTATSGNSSWNSIKYNSYDDFSTNTLNSNWICVDDSCSYNSSSQRMIVDSSSSYSSAILTYNVSSFNDVLAEIDVIQKTSYLANSWFATESATTKLDSSGLLTRSSAITNDGFLWVYNGSDTTSNVKVNGNWMTLNSLNATYSNLSSSSTKVTVSGFNGTATLNSTIVSDNLFLRFHARDVKVEIDNFRVRNYVSPEPNYTISNEFNSSNSSSGTWWNASWSKKVPINISLSSGSTMRNYPVSINVSYDSDMNANFSDLRFTNGSENTALSYWIEEQSNSAWAKVWVNADLKITTTNYTIYMYYGNAAALSTSNISATFDLGDDFNDNKIDTGKWIYKNDSGWTNETGGSLIIAGYAFNTNLGTVNSTVTFLPNASTGYAIKTRMFLYGTFQSQYNYFGFYDKLNFAARDTATRNEWKLSQSDTDNVTRVLNSTGNVFQLNNLKLNGTMNKTFEIKWINSTMIRFMWNNTYKDSIGTNLLNITNITMNTALSATMGVQALGGRSSYDWIFIRKIVEPEPRYYIGTEQSK